MVRMAKGRTRGNDYTGGWKRSALRATPELRVSHIFADVRRTKSFSLVPLFSTRKSCSVAVLTRNTRLKRFPTPRGQWRRPADLYPLRGVGQRIPPISPISSFLFSARVPRDWTLVIFWPARGGTHFMIFSKNVRTKTWEGWYVGVEESCDIGFLIHAEKIKRRETNGIGACTVLANVYQRFVKISCLIF